MFNRNNISSTIRSRSLNRSEIYRKIEAGGVNDYYCLENHQTQFVDDSDEQNTNSLNKVLFECKPQYMGNKAQHLDLHGRPKGVTKGSDLQG